MTYAEFQAYMAKYGFTTCPLTAKEFAYASDVFKANTDQLYGIACDVNAGVKFTAALVANTQWNG